MDDFSNIFIEICTKLKITIQQLSEDLCISMRAISNYRNGTSSPSYEIIKKIVSRYGVNPDYILFGEGPILRKDVCSSSVVATASGSNSNAVASGGNTTIGATTPDVRQLQDIIHEKDRRIDQLTQAVIDLTTLNRKLTDKL